MFPDDCPPRDTAEEAVLFRQYLEQCGYLDGSVEIHAIYCEPWEPRVRNAYRALGIPCSRFIGVPVELDDPVIARKLQIANFVSFLDPLGKGRILGKPFRQVREARHQAQDNDKQPLIT